MKFNVDCARDVLLHLESLTFGETVTPKQVSNALPEYEPNEIVYSCLKLYEAGFIEAQLVRAPGYASPQIRLIKDIAFAGHEFLNSVRQKTIWEKTKSVAKDIGAHSLKAMASIAESVIADKIKSLF